MTPTELILKPGESVDLAREAVRRQWQPHQRPSGGRDVDRREPQRALSPTASSPLTPPQALRRASSRPTVGAVTGTSRIRIIPDLPWTFDFENVGEVPPTWWINATGKYAVRDVEKNGNKVLVKLAENPFAFAEADASVLRSDRLSATSPSKRTCERSSDAARWGTSASARSATSWCCSARHQRLELQPWQPETTRTQRVEYKWEKDKWYTMKLEVQNLDKGRVRARGKVWPKGEAEPGAWTIERIDPIGNVKGSAGIYSDAPSNPAGGSEIYYDNIKVYRNKK